MALNRKQIANIYRPVGPKLINTATWASGGSQTFAQQVDLSLPIRGFRIVFKGRLVIGTAAMTNVNPEGLLNLIQEIKIFGNNARQKGNVTLYDIDLATLWVMQHLFALRQGYFEITSGGVQTEVATPSNPFPSTYINGSTGTYDFRISIDLPLYPFLCPPGVRPGFIARQEEWKDSITLQLFYGSAPAAPGAVETALGLAAATTTLTFSSFGSGTGAPTIDLYSLPVIMGLDLKDQTLPGFCTRTSQPIVGPIVNGGVGQILLAMQKQPTTRVILKSGTSALQPFFKTLDNGSIVSQVGVTLGGNRSVRNKVDRFAHNQDQVEDDQRDNIQGYFLFDFMQSNNPDSAYPGDAVGEGTTFSLVGDAAATANGYGIVIQEQVLYRHEGPLYSF